MYADRYARQPSLKPGSLTLALALTALPIVGLIVSTGVSRLIRDDKPFTLIPVAAPKPPPPPDIRPRPQPEAKAPATEKVVVPPIKPIELKQFDPIDVTDIKQPTEPPLVLGTGTGAEIGAGPKEVTPVLVGASYDPRYANALQPPYPAAEIRAGNDGRVVLRVLIGTDGRVKQVERVSATSDAFFAAAEHQALTKWRFKPATRDGVAIEQWKQMSLRFTLTDNQ